ncbi:MAG: SDR family NAD(P)-dependent oxidoreductase [Gammaproteobacteria bacterium]|nr:SDR family NAD(P)-dependent oxidoreductase [Gammaproteobacteria bacterium]NIM72247.1 SDR family NAD(P)-dependent oxidoreductase [Gammaproteobacteria bacterium]NIN39162.1 SDR family NAD(P)-dependent oxidoreductase [Gammaproteobacteria bacterium]NIO23995.1 SDR family NAD(P)-dependent oxidoreductase [Gammaproteobacteria bacterium]NIO64647.1 SDR family NAD(P)-dependent oxidoreductase [Gammaproteobacteria bacterium]
MALEDYSCALVTGASSGIGAAVVRSLRARGLTVHAVARRRERLEVLAEETGCECHELDVRDTARVFEVIGALDADIVVNNAGLGRGFGNLHEARPEDIDTTIDTNVRAAIQVLRASLPGMLARNRGHLVNMSSVSALHPLASTVYGASKAALHLLSQNLRLELAGSRVRVTEICPGRVSTEFFDAAIDEPEKRSALKETGITELAAGDIADAVIYALDAPWRVNVSLIELQPTEQIFGGMSLRPAN